MAYLPGFDNDIFISYTHKDNLGPGALPDTGWVTRFHLDLQRRLTELGVHARIWRDKKLRGSDDFSDEIFAQLKGSAVFIPILSPGYLRSTWCQNELEEFQKAALQSGGFEIGKVVRAILAIHLTGPRYGKRPEGTDQSIVALQYELARRGGLQRVVWVATKPEDTEAPQAAFLEALRAGCLQPRRPVSGDRKRGQDRPGRRGHDRQGAYPGHARGPCLRRRLQPRRPVSGDRKP